MEQLRNLVAPAKPLDKNYHELIAVMNKHQNPKPSVRVERYKFNIRESQPGESIQFYATELKRLSEHCDSGFRLDNTTRDRLVCGVRMTEVSFEEALKIACAMERAKKNVCDTEAGTAEVGKMQGSVNKLQGREKEINEKGYKKKLECFQCGGNHFQTRSRFKNNRMS